MANGKWKMANFGTALAIVRDARCQMPVTRGFAHILVRSEELGVSGPAVGIVKNGKWEMENGKFRNCVGNCKASQGV